MAYLPEGVVINNLIKDLKIYSWEAADILLDYSKKFKNFNFKREILKSFDHKDPVTEADLKVNEKIIKNIKKNYININWEILSEENVKNESEVRQTKSEWLWVIDPLDGTKDFIQGTGNYAMHLALNYRQRTFIGVVLIPEKDELWISDGKNTWCEGRHRKHTNKLLSGKQNLHEMILVTSKNHRNQTLERLIDKISFKRVNIMGSVGCKIASILRGESDIYLSLSLPGESSPKDWDFAAPAAILKSAGGAVTNIDNQELIYGKSNYEQGGIIVASNSKQTHERSCLQIKEIIKKYDIYPLKN